MFRGLGIEGEGKLMSVGVPCAFTLKVSRRMVNTHLPMPISVLSAGDTAVNKTDKVPNYVVYILGIEWLMNHLQNAQDVRGYN